MFIVADCIVCFFGCSLSSESGLESESGLDGIVGVFEEIFSCFNAKNKRLKIDNPINMYIKVLFDLGVLLDLGVLFDFELTLLDLLLVLDVLLVFIYL